MSLAKTVLVTYATPSGTLQKTPHRDAATFEVTSQGSLILYGDQNAKTSKMPITAYADGYWSRVDIEEEA